ncbi:amidohydrolase family protein [Halomicroarcula sp. F13]|uniref:Amidohydrolase family protein n=1 Tax=Haloarcula rubra TaxID=2487747 RepID=A0AAW4PW89_9EURY|nr:amidohydrolase family protein [Halomicroarcula rubra]MBX0325308.1 amidohydrolase family protein [Halomicroarcula rubra]
MADSPANTDDTGRIIDAHVHMNPFWRLDDDARALLREHGHGFDKKLELARNPEQFVKYLDEQGVEKAAIINYVSPILGYTHDVNDWAADFRDTAPDRILAFGGFDPNETADAEAELDHALDDLDLDGIKIHPPHQNVQANDYLSDPGYRDSGGLRRLYERCAEADVPVMVHTGTSIFPGARSRLSDPMPLDDVAVDFPDLDIIMAHGGRPMYTDEAWFLLRRHENIYFDISSIPPSNLLNHFPRLEEVVEQVLFGTDWPGPMVPGIKENAEAVRSLPLSPEALDRILYGTSAELFNIE